MMSRARGVVGRAYAGERERRQSREMGRRVVGNMFEELRMAGDGE